MSVQTHDSSEVETPESVNTRGADLDRERGSTTALPQELGANLPLFRCRFDARGTPTYIEVWCAHLRLGTDNKISTRGVSRFQKLGNFKKFAHTMKWRRRFERGTKQGQALIESLME